MPKASARYVVPHRYQRVKFFVTDIVLAHPGWDNPIGWHQFVPSIAFDKREIDIGRLIENGDVWIFEFSSRPIDR